MKSSASAPGKVILFGEHFVVYGTKAILCAIDRRITATSELIDEDEIRIRSEIGDYESPLEIPEADRRAPRFMKPFLHLAREALGRSGKSRGIELRLESEIPPGIGLGSSSAACVAAAASCAGLFGRESREEILRRAVDAERTIFEDASGADTAVSALGGLVAYTKSGMERIDSKGGLSLIIANSKQVHSTREEVLKVRGFKEKNEQAFAELCREEAAIVDSALPLLASGDLRALGKLMTRNQEMLRRIGVSTERLDMLVGEAARTSYGAKITGAGGGGCIIALVDDSNAAQTLGALAKTGECFVARIDFEGLRYHQLPGSP